MIIRVLVLSALVTIDGCGETTPSLVPLAEGMTRHLPETQPVPVGSSARIELYAHCGLDNAVIDFGGVLWDAVGYPGRFPNPPRGIDDPIDAGTITLQAENRAIFVSSSGLAIALSARDGPKDVLACY